MDATVEHPGEMVRYHMARAGMRQRELAALLGRHESWVSMLVKAHKGRITADFALRLEEVFPDVQAESWAEAQWRWDLALERRRATAIVDKMKAP